MKKIIYKTSILVFAFIIAIPMVFSDYNAYAKTYNQGNAMKQYTSAEIPGKTVNNLGSLQKKKPKKFKYSKNYKKKNTYETKANTIKPVKGVRSSFSAFKTVAFLPPTYKKSADWGNAQSMVRAGKYLYIIVPTPGKLNKGRIIRYNYDQIVKKKLYKGKGLAKLRKASVARMRGSASKKETKLLKDVIKVGPEITIGHGQSLAYNPKSKELWMSLDTETKKGWASPFKATLQRINHKTLKVNKKINFTMSTYGVGIQEPHNLVFDENGYGYFATFHDDKSMRIYRLYIKSNKVHVEFIQRFINGITNTNIQGIAYNRKSQRLYIIATDLIWSLPKNSLGQMMVDPNSGQSSPTNNISINYIPKLVSDDFQYTMFNSAREFEALTFDNAGYAYLLTIRGPEILRTTKPILF